MKGSLMVNAERENRVDDMVMDAVGLYLQETGNKHMPMSALLDRVVGREYALGVARKGRVTKAQVLSSVVRLREFGKLFFPVPTDLMKATLFLP